MAEKSGLVENKTKAEVKIDIKKSPKTDDNFVAPDGGWGWVVVLATGFSNFCTFAVLQNFGLLFKERFQSLGINASQTTSIINIHLAVTACLGLGNGPLFRKFSYRQISLAGGCVCAISVTILSTMKTFTGVLVFFSIFYAMGIGSSMSANSLALNTYFKEKRRMAMGFAWTCTGIGPIIMPQIITALLPIYDMEGTVLIYGAFTFNAVACALLLQPVSWHTKKVRKLKIDDKNEKVYQELNTDSKKALENGGPTTNRSLPNNSRRNSLNNVDESDKTLYDTINRTKQKFGSQYLYYDDEEQGATGIDVIAPGTPMMSRANDGWFSKKSTSTVSLASRSSRKESVQRSPTQSISLSRPSSLIALNKGSSIRNLTRQTNEAETKRRNTSIVSTPPLNSLNESCEHNEENCQDANCNFERRLAKLNSDNATEETCLNVKEDLKADVDNEENKPEASRFKRFLQAVVIFFDLDLLRDPVYVNLMLGVTFANLAEQNFALMTPFILGEYGFTKFQVATFMSVLAGVDVVTRITIPFVASFIDWHNRTFFLVGISGMALGRIVVAHVNNFGVMVAVAILIGAGKALRTVFVALVIPSHVPLSKLPGATGLQLLTTGVVTLSFGPVIGWIRDVAGDYAIMLHILNVFTYLTVLSWVLEMCILKRRAKKQTRSK